MNILITGGAGYIGGHVAKQLCEQTDHNIFIIDNLSTGTINTIHFLKQIRDVVFFKVCLSQKYLIETFIKEHRIDTVFHFAASIVVPESVSDPLKYYFNNTVNTINLIDICERNHVRRFIFSSTAAVYGEPKEIIEGGVDESYPVSPINPYGQSKLMSEMVLRDVAGQSQSMKYVIFRYFNVSGADMFYEGDAIAPRIGQSAPKATHLIKVLAECVLEKRDGVSVFGSDFDTKDGTGVRDYIHVEDLAKAHVLAIGYLLENESDTFNVGYGKGFSVLEVISAMQEASKKNIRVFSVERRAGDPACLIANSSKIKEKMKWKPDFDALEFICESALQWERTLNA